MSLEFYTEPLYLMVLEGCYKLDDNNIDNIKRESPNIDNDKICGVYALGKIENNESPLDAVIRETCEELGTNVKNVNIISPIDLLITPGNMIIHPFVGYINNIDSLHINKDEVDHIFLVPLSYLLKHKPSLYNNEVKVIPNDNFPYDIIPNKKDYKFATSNYRVLFYKYENYVIWGITAKILENFLEFLEV